MSLAPTYGTGVATETVVGDDQKTLMRNRISWGAVFAGIVAALVVQLLLNLLGLGIGASSLSVSNSADNPSASGFSVGAGIWWTLSGIAASFIGGAVAGRLCGTSDNNTAHWHGVVSWCASTLLVVYLLTSAVGGLIGGAFSALGSTVSTVGSGAASAVTGIAQSANGDAIGGKIKQMMNPDQAQTAQDNVVAYIRASVDGDKATADAARDRAVDSMAKAANISPDEARARLQQVEDQARQAADQVKDKALKAAQATRKGIASAGILGFIALALGGVASWFGGGVGAAHRETSIVSTAASRI